MAGLLRNIFRQPNALPLPANPRQLQPLQQNIFAPRVHPFVLGGVALASVGVGGAILVPYLLRKEKDPMNPSRIEAAILSITVMITLTSAVFLVPFHGDFNVLAGVGFVMVVVYDDEKLPRHVFDSISTGFSMLFRLVADLIKMLFRSVADLIKMLFRSVADLIKMLFDLITMLFGSVADLIKGIYGGVTELAKGLYGGVTELVKGLYGGITGLVEGLYGGVTELVKGLFRGIGSAAGSLWTAITSMFGDFRKAIIEVWPYAKIEDMAKLLSLAIFLVMAPAIAHELHNIIQYFAGAAVALQYGNGPAAANAAAARAMAP